MNADWEQEEQKLAIRLRFVLALVVLISACSLLGQVVSETKIETREVGFLDLSDVQSVDTFRHPADSGVVGIVWSCDPSSDSKRVTPAIMLLSVVGNKFRVGESVTVDVGVFNVCDTPIEIPWSPVPVEMTKAQELHPHASLSVSIDSDDPQIVLGPDANLYGLKPVSTRTLHRGDLVRIRMRLRFQFKPKAIGDMGTEVTTPLNKQRSVTLSATGHYREFDPAKKQPWSGPFPTSGQYWKTVEVAVLPEQEGTQE